MILPALLRVALTSHSEMPREYQMVVTGRGVSRSLAPAIRNAIDDPRLVKRLVVTSEEREGGFESVTQQTQAQSCLMALPRLSELVGKRACAREFDRPELVDSYRYET